MKKKLITWIYLWLPVAFWCGLIYFFSGIPNLSSGLEYDFFLRKMAHGLEYAILAALIWRAIQGSTRWDANRICITTIVFCILYAASDEWHQSFVISRSPAVRDVVVDSLGVLIMSLVLWRGHLLKIISR